MGGETCKRPNFCIVNVSKQEEKHDSWVLCEECYYWKISVSIGKAGGQLPTNNHIK